MCLLFAASRVMPDCPLLMFMNREESPSRPTRVPSLVSDGEKTAWLGGLDLEAGGTWLGVNRNGLVVALTNRAKTVVGSPLRSRGLLCRDLLNCLSIDDALAKLEGQTARSSFAGFNVLLLTTDDAAVAESGDRFHSARIPAGIHAITNARLNDLTDPRIARVRDECAGIIDASRPLRQRIGEAQRVSGLAGDGQRPGLCVHEDHRETVSSTIIALTTGASRGHYYYAAGPPCRTPFDDFTAVFRQLVTGCLP